MPSDMQWAKHSHVSHSGDFPQIPIMLGFGANVKHIILGAHNIQQIMGFCILYAW